VSTPRAKDGTKVLIAGAGALGSVFGGFLRRAGFSVTLLGRADHLERVEHEGLAIDGIWGEHRAEGFATATQESQIDGSFDAILITVKSYDTVAMAKAVAPLLDAEGHVLSLQNGLGNVEAIESIFGPERTLGVRVIFGAELKAAGHAHVSVIADPNAVGSLDPRAYPDREIAAREWAAALDDAGIPSVYTDHLAARLWAKVLYNAALNPLGALLGVHYGALPEQEESRAIMDAVIEEAFAVAVADDAGLPFASAEEYRREFYERLVPATYNHRPSMLQDLESGRRTEIGAITGEIVARGARYGIPTPVNQTLARLIALAERGAPGR